MKVTKWRIAEGSIISPKLNELRKKEKKKTHRHTAASSDFWKLPLPSFACPNLHHTTHRSSPPHRSPELCMELVNILEPPWATTKGLFFMICPFPHQFQISTTSPARHLAEWTQSPSPLFFFFSVLHPLVSGTGLVLLFSTVLTLEWLSWYLLESRLLLLSNFNFYEPITWLT